MPLMSYLAGLLLSLVGSFVGRVLLALGMSIVSYQGVSYIFGELRVIFDNQISGLPYNMIGAMGLLKIGTCFSILISALTVKWMASGLNSGSFKRLTLK